MVTLYGSMMPKIPADDLAKIAVPTDFLGVNYYNRTVVSDDPTALPLRVGSVRPEGEYTAMDWEVYPDALRVLLVRLARDYAPAKLYITENGAAYEDTLAPDGKRNVYAAWSSPDPRPEARKVRDKIAFRNGVEVVAG